MHTLTQLMKTEIGTTFLKRENHAKIYLNLMYTLFDPIILLHLKEIIRPTEFSQNIFNSEKKETAISL